MYYFEMKTVVKPLLELKTYSIYKSYTTSRKKEIRLVNYKFYQKLFVVLISLSTILIFPESPKEIENICESHNSRELCVIW